MADPQVTADELRELIREAHGATRDLRAAIRDARAVAPAIVSEHLDAEVKRAVDKLGETTEKAMDASVAKVNREFDRLADILMGRTGPDRKRRALQIPEAIERLVASEGSPLPSPDGNVRDGGVE